MIYEDLSDSDWDLCEILERETKRQKESLELIASENFTSKAVLQANGTIFTNKYSEGYPGKRYYGGNEEIDALELLCKKRALEAFGLDDSVWDVNVQAYSGSTANFSVYTALLNPGDRLMGLDLPSGGHLTHGYYTANKKISSSSIYFNSLPYGVGTDFRIDYDGLERDAKKFKPRLIIAGASAYVFDYDYARFKAIASSVGAYLMADIAHTAGLVSAGLLRSPFEVCDVVTTTTHKTLRGPRGALIFYKKELKEKIDFAVFPSNQGGPHNNTISAICTAMKQVCTAEFKEYAAAVIRNAKFLAKALGERGFDVVSGDTENHIVLINVRSSKGIGGSRFEKVAEACNVSVNKNTIATDTSALNPSGVRLGTPAMTTRGFKEYDFEIVAGVLEDIASLAKKIQDAAAGTTLADFVEAMKGFTGEIDAIKQRVIIQCTIFDLPE